MLNDCLLGGDGKKASVNKGLMLQLFPKLAAICFIGKAWDIQMSHIFLRIFDYLHLNMLFKTESSRILNYDLS